ncbi:hypothetical protein KUCAC02_008789, partial [Chaenocephalus aceratus]
WRKPVNTTVDPAHVEDFNPFSKDCKKAPEHGPCRPLLIIERYFYNPSSMTCEIFSYGGCLGNLNNFEDKVEKPVNTTVDPAHVEDFNPVSKVCKKAPETGPCEAYMERYFYNPSSMTCEIFIYGGCLGNLNNFEDKAKCMSHCRR